MEMRLNHDKQVEAGQRPSPLDASWSSNFEAQGRESDETALDYLAAALVEQGSAYAEYSDSDVPESPDATPKTYTKEEVKQSLIAYKDERASEYNDRTREGDGLTNQYSEQWQFYDKNLAADKSLSDYGDMAAGALTGLADTVENLVSPWISDPVGAAESTSMGMQQMLYDPVGTGSMIFEAKEEGQINAALDDLQGDYFSSARTEMSTDLGFVLDLGLLGRLGSSTTKVRIGSFGGELSGDITKKLPDIATPYKRPSGATTRAQREFVQNKPCVDCGATTPKQVADHKTPLVIEYYETGTIDKTKMRSLDAVQPQCPTCSARQGAEMSKYSKQQKKDRGL